MKAIVKYQNDERQFGFCEGEDGISYFFSGRGYYRREYSQGQFKFQPQSEGPKLENGAEIFLLKTGTNKKGPVATEWTVPTLNETVKLYFVERTIRSSRSIDTEPTCDHDKKMFVSRQTTEISTIVEIAFVGALEECQNFVSVVSTSKSAKYAIRPVGE